jgi:uncharacterized protein
MVTREQIDAAVRILVEAAKPERIVLFGSHARGDTGQDSDVDFWSSSRGVEDRAGEMVRLRRLLRPLRVPVDIFVYSTDEIERWGKQPGSALYWALREGKVVHG